MTALSPEALLVLADDLSGALETAAVLGAGTVVSLGGPPPSAGLSTTSDGGGISPSAGVVVVDVDTRRHPGAEVVARVSEAAKGAPGGRVRLVKIDSLLRGHVAATLAALASPERSVVVCPALPGLGRTVSDGVVRVNGTPLHETDLWHVEPNPAPASILELLAVGSRTLTAAQVADGTLAACLRKQPGRVFVPDAATAQEVRAIVEAAIASGAEVDLVGSAELARQWPAGSAGEVREVAGDSRPELFVLGSAALVVREQAASMAPCSNLMELTSSDLLEPAEQHAERLTALLEGRAPVVLSLPEDVGSLTGTALTNWLAELVAAVDHSRPDLFLCGGETARAVLDRLGTTRLCVIAEAHPGAALAVDDDGRLVCTRPGSHGSPDSLLIIHRAIREARSSSRSAQLQNKE